MNHACQFSLNPSSIKSEFTKRFVRSLLKINRQRVYNNIPCCCSSSGEITQKCRRVKSAADKSLAFAVGRRRAWSRAMIFKIRNRAQRRRRKMRLQGRVSIKTIKHHRPKNKNCSKKNINDHEDGYDQEIKLRKLVPGGEGMDLCTLLDEAAHYVKCLNIQVNVMRSIADLSSTSNPYA